MDQNAIKTEECEPKNVGFKIRDAIWNFFTKKTENAPDDDDVDNDKNDESSEGLEENCKQISVERWMKGAQKRGFSRSDLTVAVMFDHDNPLQWLVDEWMFVIDRIVKSALYIGCKQPINDVGFLSKKEAKSAMYLHKNIDDAVSECIKQRQEKFKKLQASGDFLADDIINALYHGEGDFAIAYDYLVNWNVGSQSTNIEDKKEPSDAEIVAGEEINCEKLIQSLDINATKADSVELDSKSKDDQETRIRRFIAEGIFDKPEMAEVASQLISLNIAESDAIAVAKECSTVDSALTYLQLQECPICATEFCIGKMFTMLNCEHRVCLDCTTSYFSYIIKERNIMEAVCPCCQEPGLNDEEVANQYFLNLQIMLKHFIDHDVYDLFDQKLRDRTLMLDPNFRWCQTCGSGFIAAFDQMQAVCPDCNVIFCVKCNSPWEKQHEGISCEKFTQWKLDNDERYQSAGVEKHLAVYGIGCPKCKFRYELAKGGCMHFICFQCKHQFCSGCGGTYQQNEQCRVSQTCHNKGLHAHHPRTCLYYLRDWECEQLLKLIDDNKVNYVINGEEGDNVLSKKCPVVEQKEMPDSNLVDAVCGKNVKENCSGLCKLHFVEYLVNIITKHGLDPVDLMSIEQLQQELKRNEKLFPSGEDTEQYRNTLKQLVREEIPLGDMRSDEVPHPTPTVKDHQVPMEVDFSAIIRPPSGVRAQIAQPRIRGMSASAIRPGASASIPSQRHNRNNQIGIGALNPAFQPRGRMYRRYQQADSQALSRGAGNMSRRGSSHCGQGTPVFNFGNLTQNLRDSAGSFSQSTTGHNRANQQGIAILNPAFHSRGRRSGRLHQHAQAQNISRGAGNMSPRVSRGHNVVNQTQQSSHCDQGIPGFNFGNLTQNQRDSAGPFSQSTTGLNRANQQVVAPNSAFQPNTNRGRRQNLRRHSIRAAKQTPN